MGKKIFFILFNFKSQLEKNIFLLKKKSFKWKYFITLVFCLIFYIPFFGALFWYLRLEACALCNRILFWNLDLIYDSRVHGMKYVVSTDDKYHYFKIFCLYCTKFIFYVRNYNEGIPTCLVFSYRCFYRTNESVLLND